MRRKIWTTCPGAGQGTTILSVSRPFRADSPAAVEWLLFPRAPFIESSLPRPAAGWFCSAVSDDASPGVPDPSVPPARAAPGPAAQGGNTSHHVYFQLKTFSDGNCNLNVLALPFCSGNPGAVLQGGGGGQGRCHSRRGRGGVRLPLPAAFSSVFWVDPGRRFSLSAQR